MTQRTAPQIGGPILRAGGRAEIGEPAVVGSAVEWVGAETRRVAGRRTAEDQRNPRRGAVRIDQRNDVSFLAGNIIPIRLPPKPGRQIGGHGATSADEIDPHAKGVLRQGGRSRQRQGRTNC